jgi:hypothetical protein
MSAPSWRREHSPKVSAAYERTSHGRTRVPRYRQTCGRRSIAPGSELASWAQSDCGAPSSRSIASLAACAPICVQQPEGGHDLPRAGGHLPCHQLADAPAFDQVGRTGLVKSTQHRTTRRRARHAHLATCQLTTTFGVNRRRRQRQQATTIGAERRGAEGAERNPAETGLDDAGGAVFCGGRGPYTACGIEYPGRGAGPARTSLERASAPLPPRCGACSSPSTCLPERPGWATSGWTRCGSTVSLTRPRSSVLERRFDHRCTVGEAVQR